MMVCDFLLFISVLICDFFEDYKKYYLMKEFCYSNIIQFNCNCLFWIDLMVDGVKMGYIEVVGYCLIFLVLCDKCCLFLVVFGIIFDSVCVSELQKLFNWGFIFYDVVMFYVKYQVVFILCVWKGMQNQVKVGFGGDFIIVVLKGYIDKLQVQFILQQVLMVLVQVGQKVGMVKVIIDGKVYGEYLVVVFENVLFVGIFGCIVDSVKFWFN